MTVLATMLIKPAMKAAEMDTRRMPSIESFLLRMVLGADPVSEEDAFCICIAAGGGGVLG